MKISPKKILWPTDLSPLSSKAAEYVRGFRDTFGAEIHILHVCAPLPNMGIMPDGIIMSEPSQAAFDDYLEARQEQLRQFAEEHLGDAPGTVCSVLRGHPCSEICGYAKGEGIDLIIIATHGSTGLKHFLIGSTAERVVQHASCPVLTVKSVEREFTAG